MNPLTAAKSGEEEDGDREGDLVDPRRDRDHEPDHARRTCRGRRRGSPRASRACRCSRPRRRRCPPSAPGRGTSSRRRWSGTTAARAARPRRAGWGWWAELICHLGAELLGRFRHESVTTPTIYCAAPPLVPSDRDANMCSWRWISNLKGNVAELAIAKEAALLGLGVLMPDGRARTLRPGARRSAGGCFRVQCKWASFDGRCRSGRSAHVSAHAAATATCGRSTGADEIDAGRRLLRRARSLLSSFRSRRSPADPLFQLRLSPARNSQRAAINFAADYEFAGAVAQLEERCMACRGRGFEPRQLHFPQAGRRRGVRGPHRPLPPTRRRRRVVPRHPPRRADGAASCHR